MSDEVPCLLQFIHALPKPMLAWYDILETRPFLDDYGGKLPKVHETQNIRGCITSIA